MGGMTNNWTAHHKDYVPENFPDGSPLRFYASKAKMETLFGPPNSTDDPSKTTAAYNLTDGVSWIHTYDYKQAEDNPNNPVEWSVRGDTENAAADLVKFVEGPA